VAVGGYHTVNATMGGHVLVPTIDFASGPDPHGTDASVSAHWTVGGMAATSASCAASGITRVRVAVLAPTGPIELAPLVTACTAGSIDTRPMTVLAAGDVVLQLQALSAQDAVLFSGPLAMTTVPHGPAHVALYADAPVDFGAVAFDPHGSDANVAYAWTLDRQMPAVDLCDAVGVTTVALVLYDASDTSRAHGVDLATAACSRGSFDSAGSPIVRAGSYLATLEARDAMGGVRASAPWSAGPITVVAGAVLTEPTVDFAFPTTLAVTLDWELPMSTGTGTCASAGVATMTYTLAEHASGTVVAQATSIPCSEAISFDAMHVPTLGAAAGYDLVAHGVSADMAHTWASPPMQCSNFAVQAGGITFEACVVASM
jgi:hypothetical protein